MVGLDCVVDPTVLAPELRCVCLPPPVVTPFPEVEAARRTLGSTFWTGRSGLPLPEETSVCDEDPEALTGRREVLSVVPPPMLRYFDVLLDVSDGWDK